MRSSKCGGSSPFVLEFWVTYKIRMSDLEVPIFVKISEYVRENAWSAGCKWFAANLLHVACDALCRSAESWKGPVA